MGITILTFKMDEDARTQIYLTVKIGVIITNEQTDFIGMAKQLVAKPNKATGEESGDSSSAEVNGEEMKEAFE